MCIICCRVILYFVFLVIRSSQGSPDWTCIVAGFESGYMRIYLQVSSSKKKVKSSAIFIFL